MTALAFLALALVCALDAYQTFARTRPVVGSRLSRECINRIRTYSES